MADLLLTRGQLERKLSQDIQAFYRRHLGHQPSKVTCQLFENKLAIILEDSITNTEQILVEEGKTDLAEEVRSNLDDALHPELKKLIERIAKIEVVDILSDATFDTGRTGIIAILHDSPQLRNSNGLSKAKS